MEKVIQQLRTESTIRVAKKGGNVLFQGEIPRRAMIVRSGVIRAYTITSSGEERTVALHGKGDVFPLSWILGETSNSLFYYDAVVDTRLMLVSKETFVSTIEGDAEALSSVLRYVVNDYTALLLRITGLEQSRAIEKIGFTLYYLLFRYGIEKTPGKFVLDLKMSQLMIASLVGLTRESTTKNLKKLKEKNIIEYSSFTYTIDKTKLENFLGEDSFRDLSL